MNLPLQLAAFYLKAFLMVVAQDSKIPSLLVIVSCNQRIGKYIRLIKNLPTIYIVVDAEVDIGQSSF